MTEDVTEEVATETKSEPSLLVESKLYRLNADANFIGYIAPPGITQMQIEQLITEDYPRSETDGDKTRIFVNFTNLKGNGQLFMVIDDQRLASTFDIDGFMNGFYAKVNEGVNEDISLDIIPPSLINAINTSVVNALQLTNERVLPSVQRTSETVLKSLIAVLLNDPLDAMILLQEQPLIEGQTETTLAAVAIWTVKDREEAE